MLKVQFDNGASKGGEITISLSSAVEHLQNRTEGKMSGNLPRNDLSNRQKKSTLRKVHKKDNKRKRKQSVADKREARSTERLEHLKDGINKEELIATSKETKIRSLPKSNKDAITEKEIYRPEFTAGGYSATLIKKGGPSRSPKSTSYQERHLEKAVKNGEIGELPTDPVKIHDYVMSLKRTPTPEERAKRFIFSSDPHK